MNNIIFIVGPTASGKTSASIDLAKKIDGEIICADSRTIYKDLDIGTAKPTLEQRDGIVHWGIDLVFPNEEYSAADFKKYAYLKIEEIKQRGKTPIIVGGSGLYIDSVLFNYKFGEIPDRLYREYLNSLTLDDLYTICEDKKIFLPDNIIKNKRYVIRAIEQNGINRNKNSRPIDNSIIVGSLVERDTARVRIKDRIISMMNDGVVDEAIRASEKYGWNNSAMTGNIYSIIRSYLEGKIDYSRMIDLCLFKDYHLFKRQMTWFKRNDDIKWLKPEMINDFLLKRTNMLQ